MMKNEHFYGGGIVDKLIKQLQTEVDKKNEVLQTHKKKYDALRKEVTKLKNVIKTLSPKQAQ